MTSRERILAAINHQQPDRVPVDICFADELEKKLLQRLGFDRCGQLFEFFGQDTYKISPHFPECACDTRYADPTIKVTEEGYLLDIYYVPFMVIQTEYQSYVELAGQPPLSDYKKIEDLQGFPWPTADMWDYCSIKTEIQSHREKALWGHSRGFFEIACFMRGMDNFFMDLATNPDFACGIMDYIIDYQLAKSEKILTESDGEIVFFEYNDDMASQHALFISPDMWRKYIKPRMAKFCDLIHSYGAKVRYHCCGSCYDIIFDLIEIGVDILSPIQALATNMDPFKLKEEFGDKLCFHGGIDIQQLLPNSSSDVVYEHVCKMVDVVGKNGGYILDCSHTIQADTPIDNVLAIADAVRSSCRNATGI
jgi:uroporphyrinogen decarboxylase